MGDSAIVPPASAIHHNGGPSSEDEPPFSIQLSQEAVIFYILMALLIGHPTSALELCIFLTTTPLRIA
jgi:hypothetical protein